MITLIKMPNTIESLEQFNEWVKSLDTPTQELEIWMKRRTNYYPYYFTYSPDGDTIQYLISDGISRGECKIKNFNKVFKFQLRTV